MEKYQNKYRIPPARAPFWDYAWNASYFVTVCTQNRICWFGNVVNGQMVLSEIGEIAHQCWSDIPKHFPFVKLDAFVVMPNHVHGIVTIDKSDYDIKNEQNSNERDVNERNSNERDVNERNSNERDGNEQNSNERDGNERNSNERDVETQNFASLPRIPSEPQIPLEPDSPSQPNTPPPRTQNKFGPQSKNLASIIRGFKIGVTKNVRLIQPDFAWQTRYHDHIIRDELAHYNISEYIINNPAKWSDDQFYMPWHE